MNRKGSVLPIILMLVSIIILGAIAITSTNEKNKQKELNRQWQEAAAPIMKNNEIATPEDLNYFLQQLRMAKELATNNIWKIESVDSVSLSVSNIKADNEVLLFPQGRTKHFYEGWKKGEHVMFKFHPDVVKFLEPTEFLEPVKATSLHPSKIE